MTLLESSSAIWERLEADLQDPKNGHGSKSCVSSWHVTRDRGIAGKAPPPGSALGETDSAGRLQAPTQ